MKIPVFTILWAVVVSIATSLPSCAANLYNVVDLGGAPASFAIAINEVGQVAGTSGKTGFFWDAGTLTSIGVLSGNTESEAIDINDAGVVVGYSRDPSRAVTWSSGRLTELGLPQGLEGHSINNAGRVVGMADGIGNAAVWDGGTISFLAPLEGFGGAVPEKINDAGKVVGWSFTAGVLAEHPTSWEGANITYLGNLPGYERGMAESINTIGQIVGWGQHADGKTNPRRAFFWQAGILTDIGAADGFTASQALAINDLGDIVGLSGDFPSPSATIWQGGAATDLNKLLAPQSLGWHIQIAYDINNAGQIVGQAKGPDHVVRAVLLNPVPKEPPGSPRASARAVVVNGFVVGVYVTAGGHGYTEPPLVIISGGGGTGATAMAIMSESIVIGFKVTNPGHDYTSAPQVLVASPPFAPQVAVAVSRVNVSMKVGLGKKYQLEASHDLKAWSATGPEFVATEELLNQEFVVAETGQFFRLLEVP